MRFLLAFASCVVAGLAGFEWLAQRRDTRRFPPPGRLIGGGAGKLHVYESGSGTTPVILESGLTASSVSWRLVQQELSGSARVISYDRAGLGWSAQRRSALSLENMLADLHSVVEAVAGSDRVLLVGHSFGGLLVMAFATRHPERLAGLILVDPVSIREWCAPSMEAQSRLARAVRLSRRGAWLARFGIVRLCLISLSIGYTVIPKLVARTSAGQGTSVLARLTGELRRLPPALWPAIFSQWSRAGGFSVMAEYLRALPKCAQAVRDWSPPPGVPLVVLSAGSATPAEIEEREQWLRQASPATHIKLRESSHWIQLQDPGAVVSAIRSLLSVHATRTPGEF